MYAGPVLGRKSLLNIGLKGRHIISLPVAPISTRPALVSKIWQENRPYSVNKLSVSKRTVPVDSVCAKPCQDKANSRQCTLVCACDRISGNNRCIARTLLIPIIETPLDTTHFTLRTLHIHEICSIKKIETCL
jgi:hypothetical protein